MGLETMIAISLSSFSILFYEAYILKKEEKEKREKLERYRKKKEEKKKKLYSIVNEIKKHEEIEKKLREKREIEKMIDKFNIRIKAERIVLTPYKYKKSKKVKLNNRESRREKLLSM